MVGKSKSGFKSGFNHFCQIQWIFGLDVNFFDVNLDLSFFLNHLILDFMIRMDLDLKMAGFAITCVIDHL